MSFSVLKVDPGPGCGRRSVMAKYISMPESRAYQLGKVMVCKVIWPLRFLIKNLPGARSNPGRFYRGLKQ
jgi:hypothetical protein